MRKGRKEKIIFIEERNERIKDGRRAGKKNLTGGLKNKQQRESHKTNESLPRQSANTNVKDGRWVEATEAFRKARSVVPRKGSLHDKRRPKKHKREDCLLHVTEEAKNKMKNDKVVTIDDLADSTRDWRATCMETDVLAERKKINKKKKKCGAWSRNTSY